MSKNIKEFVTTFFEKMQVGIDSLEITSDGNRHNIYIESLDSAILIGKQGANIYAIQRILTMLLNKLEEGNDEGVSIKLEINGYLEMKDSKLFSFIDNKISKLENKGDSVVLPDYSPYERKKIHSYISKTHPAIKSTSQGQGENRRMTLIQNKTSLSRLSIDINSDTI